MAKYFRLREGWLMVGLVALLLFSVIWSIQRAGWSDGLFILTPITLAGMGTALLLSRIRGVPRLLLHLTGLTAGAVIVLWETANLLDDPRLVTIQDRVQDLLSRAVLWSRAVAVGDASDDMQLFLLALAVLTWLLAFSSTWFVFRSRWLWWALVPPGLALIVNISYSSASLGWYFVLFMLSALLLMVRFNMLLHEERWERERVNYSPGLSWTFLRASSVFALVVAVVMWYMPTQDVNHTLSDAWDHINGPWQDLQQRWSAAFAGVPGTGNFGYATFNDSFSLGGALNLGDGIVLRAASDRPLYWRAKTYDSFNGRSWKTTAPDTFHGRNVSSRLSLDPNQVLHSNDGYRLPVTVTVQLVRPKDNIIFAPLRPASLSVGTRLAVSWQDLNQSYSIPGDDPQKAPIELQQLLTMFTQARLEALQAYGRDPRTPDTGGQPLPDGDPTTIARAVLDRTGQSAAISTQIDQLRDRGILASYWLVKDNFKFVVRAVGPVPVYDDLSAVYSADRLQPNQQYTVQSLITNVDKETMRRAGTDYPTWVTDRYLQVQSTLPGRVFAKAREVVDQAGATNPYDEAVAIQNFLRTYKYSTKIALPPSGRDDVDYFLFDSQEGYCEYYSTAMVIMLRTLRIPAREAVGYAPGEYDANTHQWTVRESASHAWPEVYFPGAGWVEFEPTPSQNVIDRPDSAQAALASPTPYVDLTPRAVPTHINPADAGDTATPVPAAAGSLGPGAGAGGPVLLLGLGFLALLIAFVVVRGRAQQQAVAQGRLVLGGIQYYERLLRLAWWLGLRPRPHDTPFEFAEQVSAEVPGARPYVTPIARAYVHERFGRHRPDRSEQQELAQVWGQLRARLLRRMSEARQWLQRR